MEIIICDKLFTYYEENTMVNNTNTHKGFHNKHSYLTNLLYYYNDVNNYEEKKTVDIIDLCERKPHIVINCKSCNWRDIIIN